MFTEISISLKTDMKTNTEKNKIQTNSRYISFFTRAKL